MNIRTRYINAGLLSAAVLLLGYAALNSTPASLARGAKDTLADVSLTVGVAPNPYNTEAEQLADKQQQLNQEQATLTAEQTSAAQTQSTTDRWGFYSLCVSGALFVLVALNFYLDMRRRRQAPAAGAFSVDLR